MNVKKTFVTRGGEDDVAIQLCSSCYPKVKAVIQDPEMIALIIDRALRPNQAPSAE